MNSESDRAVFPNPGIKTPGLSLNINYAHSFEPDVPRLDFKRIINTDSFVIQISAWRVKWMGRYHGRKNIFSDLNGGSTSFELQIYREHLLKVNKLKIIADDYLGHARKAVELITPNDFLANNTIEKQNNIVKSWIKSFKEILTHARTNYCQSQAEYQRTNQALNEFVADKKLNTKKPLFKKNKLDRYLFLFFLVNVEAVIGMFFFSETFDGQYIRSFVFPFIFSLINVFVGLFVGKTCFDVIKHGKRSGKIFAFAALIVAFLAISWLNLSVAHLRETPSIQIENISEIAKFHGELPQTAHSIGLMILSCYIFFYAVDKGAKEHSAGFPGHEAKWNENEDARKNLNDAKKEYLTLVNVMRVTSNEQLNHVRTEILKIKAANKYLKTLANQILIDLETLENILKKNLEMIDASARILLTLYRETAQLHNKAKPSPGIKFTEPVWQKPEIETAKIRERIKCVNGVIDKNIDEITLFEELFEKSIASMLNSEVDAAANETQKLPD